MNPRVEDWGFLADERGGLVIGGIDAEVLAREFGTPLHVVDEGGLRQRARNLRRAFQTAYPAEVAVHYAMKCNNTPGIVRMILEEGLRPEVGTLYEWHLARRLGVDPGSIMVNGPNKGELLRIAIAEGAGLIVVDGPQELDMVEQLCHATGRTAQILIRINPDTVPRGMNRASATGSRKQSVFGFDRVSGEVTAALKAGRLRHNTYVTLRGAPDRKHALILEGRMGGYDSFFRLLETGSRVFVQQHREMRLTDEEVSSTHTGQLVRFSSLPYAKNVRAYLKDAMTVAHDLPFKEVKRALGARGGAALTDEKGERVTLTADSLLWVNVAFPNE